MDQVQLEKALEALKARCEVLETRVARLERRTGLADAPVEPPDTQEAAQRTTAAVSSFLNGIALICFSLLGALLLRTATTRGLLAPTTGAVMGLIYASVLVVLPARPVRTRRLEAHLGWVQACGVTLYALIILETTHRAMGLTPKIAMGATLVAGVVFTRVTARRNRARLAAFATIAAMLTLAGVGSVYQAMPWKSAALLALVVTSTLEGSRRQWASLRAAAMVSGSLALGFALLATGRRPGLPPHAAWTPFLALLVLWVLSLGIHLARRNRLGWGEASWFPLATAWTGGLTLFYLPRAGGWGGAAATPVLWASCLAMARADRRSSPALNGLAVGALVATLMFFPRVDPTGLATLGAAFGALLAWKWTGAPLLRATTALLAISATAVALHQASLFHPSVAQAPTTLWHAASLAALLLILWQLRYRRPEGTRSDSVDWTAASLLICAGICLFSTSRAVALTFGAQGGWLLLVESVTLGLLACAAMVYGRKHARRESVGLGLAGAGIFLVTLLLRDLFTLSPAQLAIEVVALGATFVVASRVWRPQQPR